MRKRTNAIYDTQPTQKVSAAQRRTPSGIPFLVGLIIGGILGGSLAAVLVVAVFTPMLRDNEAVATALQETAAIVNLTAAFNDSQMLDNQRTQLAQENDQQLIQQTSTQSALNVLATRTANSFQNQQQATQVALDYIATQSALNQQATQIELDFQSTRVGIDGAEVQSQVAARTPTPTALLYDDFRGGSRSDLWQFNAPDWGFQNGQVIANSESAVMLSQQTVSVNYRADVTLQPTIGDTVLLLNVRGAAPGIAIRFLADASQFGLVSVHLLNTGESLPIDFAQNVPFAAQVISQPFTAMPLSIEVRGSQITVLMNNEAVLTTDIGFTLSQGNIGVQLPAGTVMQEIQVN